MKLQPNIRIMSKWQYGKDGYPRWGHLPEGWGGHGTVFVQWDDDGSLQWQDQASFIVAPPLNEILKIKGGKSD